jgi:hypothetical protein
VLRHYRVHNMTTMCCTDTDVWLLFSTETNGISITCCVQNAYKSPSNLHIIPPVRSCSTHVLHCESGIVMFLCSHSYLLSYNDTYNALVTIFINFMTHKPG